MEQVRGDTIRSRSVSRSTRWGVGGTGAALFRLCQGTSIIERKMRVGNYCRHKC